MLALVIATLAYSACAVTVRTQYGAVKGKTVGGVHHFLGIPYAAPPVGDLRFAKTAPVKPWSGVLSALEFSRMCPQFSFDSSTSSLPDDQSEDCLYLNIYTPDTEPDKPLPVILFIHGGDYMFGTGGDPLYDGTDLVQKQNVVVVTINYRLGVLGALYTGEIHGNFQLLDQREAMKFTRSVIRKFGGDPERVTISGQSAGAFSVLAHMASPKSWPYFAGGIALSPPMSLPSATPSMAMDLGRGVLKKVGCLDAADQLACLQKVDVVSFVKITMDTDYSIWKLKLFAMFMQWGVVVDGDELPLSPLVALTTGQYHKVPLMMGTTRTEGITFVYAAWKIELWGFAYDIVADLLFGKETTKEIPSVYGHESGIDWRPYISKQLTDYIFYCPIRYIGDQIRNTSDIYIHYFDHVSSFNNWFFQHQAYCVKEVCHGSDLPYYFFPFSTYPASFHAPTPTKDEANLATYMQTMWGNFARTGSPNPLPGPKFNEFAGSAHDNVQELGIPVTEMSHFRKAQCDFWDKHGYNNAFHG